MVRNNQIYYIHTDHLGRPQLATNASRTLVWKASNYAFNRSVSIDSIGGLNLGYPGQYYDAEFGTWHNGYRDYLADTGKYLQSDPLGLDGGINTYAYLGGNPVQQIDPSGTICITPEQAKAAGSAVGGAIIAAVAYKGDPRMIAAGAAVGAGASFLKSRIENHLGGSGGASVVAQTIISAAQSVVEHNGNAVMTTIRTLTGTTGEVAKLGGAGSQWGATITGYAGAGALAGRALGSAGEIPGAILGIAAGIFDKSTETTLLGLSDCGCEK
jgi:RHS repeat-associated protein